MHYTIFLFMYLQQIAIFLEAVSENVLVERNKEILCNCNSCVFFCFLKMNSFVPAGGAVRAKWENNTWQILPERILTGNDDSVVKLNTLVGGFLQLPDG